MNLMSRVAILPCGIWHENAGQAAIMLICFLRNVRHERLVARYLQARERR